MKKDKARYHLPGLYEFYELYRLFLPLFREHREYFIEDCDIGSVYGAPGDCLWGGGRVGFGDADTGEVLALMKDFQVPARLTFSNSLLRPEHLSDRQCNALCRKWENNGNGENGIILTSDSLMNHIRDNYPGFYFVSSTTKVLERFEELETELAREEFRFVVPDFRLNKAFDRLRGLSQDRKDKVEFLCNEGCFFGCGDRRACYENISRKALGEAVPDHICRAPGAKEGYVFSKAMENPGYIGPEAIREIYRPMGFSEFKIEGRSLGSAMVLEFILHYMTRPEYRLKVREAIYLDASLDLF